MSEKSTHLCSSCGSSMRPKTVTPGSFFIELILWLAFIVPGLIYSIWRLSSRHKACPVCKSKNIIPINSPQGKELLNKQNNNNIEENNDDIPNQIEKLATLKEKGIITQEEFDSKKTALLSKM